MIIKRLGAKDVLPDKHRTAHNVCDVLYTQLVEVLLSDEYKSLNSTDISFEKEQHNIEGLDALDLLDLLIKYDRKDEVTTILTKKITISLLPDLMDFIRASLDACKASSFSVAYALLRKPLMDELLMLEQIFINKNEFVERFYINGDISLYDPGSKKDVARLAIIKDAIDKLPLKSLFNPDYMFEIRYDKAAKHGMNWITNQALHIVTNDSRYRTPKQNLNFIFSSSEDYEKYWHHYYSVMPLLLLYITSIVDEIIFDFLPESLQIKNIKSVRRFIIFMVWGESYTEDEFKNSEPFFNELTGGLRDNCFKCRTDISFQLKDFIAFAFNNRLECSTCKANQLDDANFISKFPLLDI